MTSIKKVTQNAWVDHVKKYQLDNGVSYSDAMKLAKATYTCTTNKKVKKIPKDDAVESVEPVEVSESAEPVEVSESAEPVEAPVKTKRVYRRRVKATPPV